MPETPDDELPVAVKTETPGDELPELRDGTATSLEKYRVPSSSNRCSASRSEIASTRCSASRSEIAASVEPSPSVYASELPSDSSASSNPPPPFVSEMRKSGSDAPQVTIHPASSPVPWDHEDSSIAPSAYLSDMPASLSCAGENMLFREQGALQMFLREFQDTLVRIENQLQELMNLPKQVENLQDVPRSLTTLEDFVRRAGSEGASPYQGSDFTTPRYAEEFAKIPKLRPVRNNRIASRRFDAMQITEVLNSDGATPRPESLERGSLGSRGTGSFESSPGVGGRASTMGTLPLLSSLPARTPRAQTPRTNSRHQSQQSTPKSVVSSIARGANKHKSWAPSQENGRWAPSQATEKDTPRELAEQTGDVPVDPSTLPRDRSRPTDCSPASKTDESDAGGVSNGFSEFSGSQRKPSRVSVSRVSSGNDESGRESDHTLTAAAGASRERGRLSSKASGYQARSSTPKIGRPVDLTTTADAGKELHGGAQHANGAMNLSDMPPENTGGQEAKLDVADEVPASDSKGESEGEQSGNSEASAGFAEKNSSHSDHSKVSEMFSGRPSNQSVSLSGQTRLDHGGRRKSLFSTRSQNTDMSGLSGSMARRSSTISFIDVEFEQEKRWMLRPNSSKRLLWDMVIILNTIFIWSVIPLYLVYFESDIISPPVHVLLLYVFDMLWPIDIALNFRTGFFLNGKLEMEPARAATNYARGWLVPDILAAWPLAWSSKDVHWVICVLKLGRLVKLVPTISRLQFEYRDMGIFQATVVILYFLVVHLATCGWRLAIEDLPQYNVTEHSIGDLYVADLYWVMMTMTTIGYGDITPQDTRSRCYAICLMISGSIAFGAMVSACTHITNALFNDPIENQVSEMMRFMNRRSVPQELQRLVQRDLRHNMHAQKSTMLNPELTAHLSPTMQRELSLSLLGRTVLRFPLFKDVQRSFLAELAQKHCWLQCLPGDVVIEEGHLVSSVIFLIRGKLLFRRRKAISQKEELSFDVGISGARELDIGNQDELGLMTYDDGEEILAGAWFGEACLFDQSRICVVTVNAVTECELAVLAAEDYLQVIHRYPSLWEKHQQIGHQITNGTLSIQELAYRPVDTPLSNQIDDTTGKKGAARTWSLRPQHKKKEDTSEAYKLREVVPQG